MNKTMVASLLVFSILSMRGAGVEVPSFQLVNGIVSDEAEDRILSVSVTYESSAGLKKQVAYKTKQCQLTVPIADSGRSISRIHVTEYYVGVPVAYNYYEEFTPELLKKLASGKFGLLVTKSEKAREDKTKELVFSFKELKKAVGSCKDGG